MTEQAQALPDAGAGEGAEQAPRGPGPLPGVAAHLRGLRLHQVAAAWAAGSAVHAAGLGAGWDVLAAGGGTALCTAAALEGAWHRLGSWGRVHAGAAAAGAAGWASWSAVHGPGGPVNAAALLAAGALALPWWLRRAPGWLAVEPDDLPDWDRDDGTPSRIRGMLDTWEMYVACEGGPLPDTFLDGLSEAADAVSADIVLRRGRQVTSQALAKWEYVASAFDLPETRVLMEPHPQGRKNRARLTVLDREVLADKREWSGSTLDPAAGTARAATFFDGKPALARFWIPGSGAAHWLIAGTTGSGKSTGVFGVIAETTDPDHPVPAVNFLLDPEEGAQSVPLWSKKLKHAYTGEDRCLRALHGLNALMDQRAREMSAEGLDCFDPSWERPQVNVIIEESSVLMKESARKADAIRLIERLGKRGRKRGVAVILVALVPSLEELDSQTLRSMLRSGNIWCFRTGDSVSASMLGLDVDPSRIPEVFADGSPTYGVCYLKGPDGRQAMARSLDIPPDRKTQIAERAVECPLDASSLAAFERGFTPPKAAPSQAGPASAAQPPADIRQQVQVRGDAAKAILAHLAAAGREQSKADILVGIRTTGITSPSTVQAALRHLVDQGLVYTAGDKFPYRVTDAGREWLAANPGQAA